MGRPKLIVFASGTKDAGGSGFENLTTKSRTYAERTRTNAEKLFDYEVVAVASNHEHGGVRERAERLGIPFIYFDPSTNTNKLKNVGMLYQEIVQGAGAEWVALSGWLKHVIGLDPAKTFNIHPALLSQLDHRFGGPGMYGHRLHEAVKAALNAGEITESGFTMHFVTDAVDGGTVFFEHRVPLTKGMSADEIAATVNKAEHEWQPKITNMVVHGEISWDGKDPSTLCVPVDYQSKRHFE